MPIAADQARKENYISKVDNWGDEDDDCEVFSRSREKIWIACQDCGKWPQHLRSVGRALVVIARPAIIVIVNSGR